ncbi:MAG: hypothetical protein ACRDD1_06745 [Planctomycetia bacterium]
MFGLNTEITIEVASFLVSTFTFITVVDVCLTLRRCRELLEKPKT